MLFDIGECCDCGAASTFTCNCLPTGTTRPPMYFSGYNTFASAWLNYTCAWTNVTTRWQHISVGSFNCALLGNTPTRPGIVWINTTGSSNIGFRDDTPGVTLTCSPFSLHWKAAPGFTFQNYNEIILTF